MKSERRNRLTARELRIWRDYIETAETIRSELSARMQRDSGLSTGDYQVLLALSEADRHRMRSSTLATHIGWQRSRLSHHLGRMERRELIRRQDCPTDSRGAEVVLTEQGLRAFRRSTSPHFLAIRETFLDALTPEQLAAAAELSAALREHQTERKDGGHDPVP
ncbi:MAG TPA: MarR family transcriptional regulator [Solirubrobacterales bacterium]|nr:MarR family transcriptional regulator [Solirubrobacterales bacterium]